MTNFINRVFRFILKLVLAAFGLVFAVSLLAAALVVVILSLLKALVTGKKPTVLTTFNRFQQYSPKDMWPGAARRQTQNSPAKTGDVVDVEVREIRNDK